MQGVCPQHRACSPPQPPSIRIRSCCLTSWPTPPSFVQHKRISEPNFCRLCCRATAPPIEYVTGGPLTGTVPVDFEDFDTESVPELPEPRFYQQTLARSFVVGGLGVQTGGYTCIRVRPAFAGDGRYFVRVPSGTNSIMQQYSQEDIMELHEVADEMQAAANVDYSVDHFLQYLQAQEAGYDGPFQAYSRATWPRDENYNTIEPTAAAPDEDEDDDEEPSKAADRQLQEQEESDSSAETASTVQQEQAGDAQSSSDAQEQAPARVVWREEDEYGDLDDVLPRPPDGEFILASLQHALDDQPYGIVLQHGHLRIESVEFLLSALEACGVDNARIEYESGTEVPVLDGSSQPWCIHLQRVGVRAAPPRGFEFPPARPLGNMAASQQDATSSEVALAAATAAAAATPGGAQLPSEGEAAAATAAAAAVDAGVTDDGDGGEGGASDEETEQPTFSYEVTDRYYASSGEVLSLREGDAFLAYYPEETPRLTCGVDHLEEAPVIGKQWYSYAPLEDDHYRWVLGPARTYFTSMQHALDLRDAGHFKGATTGCAIIASGGQWYDSAQERFYGTEAARHQLSRLIGDLSLLASNGHAGLPCGHIICYKAQAPLRMRFARQLQAQLELTVGKLEAVQGTNAEDAEGSVEESLDAGGDTDTPTANG